ncbi:MAG: hypothetical protein V4820_07465 [Pseudomonadota bacterium]
MKIAYLDQNKWIELARAVKDPAAFPGTYALLKDVGEAVEAGRLALPLTATNLYETSKINDPQRRHDLAFTQIVLSKGRVFRGRYSRLEVEVSNVLREDSGLAPTMRDTRWFLSELFLEAYADIGDPRVGVEIPARVMEVFRQQPLQAFYQFLVLLPNETRTEAVQRFSAGAEDLRRRIETRRTRDAAEPISMRRKVYGALLIIDEIELILAIARRAGLSWASVADMPPKTVLRLARDVPTYFIERELSLRLEAQSRPIEENDMRDMQAFCAVLPYADLVVAENQFVSLARQANLGEKYGSRLSTDLHHLGDIV